MKNQDILKYCDQPKKYHCSNPILEECTAGNYKEDNGDCDSDIYQKIADQIAGILREKNKSYGDSYGKSPEFLRLLYPNGVTPEQYPDLLFVVRIFDKLMRIASQKDAFNEDAFLDICGYSTLSLVENNKKSAS